MEANYTCPGEEMKLSVMFWHWPNTCRGVASPVSAK